MKVITPNPGAQGEFIKNPARMSAYIGGLGSGKTFAGIARGLERSQQRIAPGSKFGPRGLCAAISYPVLKDVVLPQFMDLIDGSGLEKGRNWYLKAERKALLKANCGCKDRDRCPHVTEVLFRSLDNPDSVRGVELAWAFIDEGRHLTRYAFDVVNGRLRQRGYTHQVWVCSTPNGYDWMWDVFHPDSPKAYAGTQWFEAPTYENRHHVGEEYIKTLEATYEGKFFEQEVLGKFVGIVQGAVFPHWDSPKFLVPVSYDPGLPLVSMWDFGVGDPGTCLFAQVDWQSKQLPSGGTEEVPVLKYHSYIEATDWSAKDWARAFREHCDEHFGGRRPERNVGDPAGRQRNAATGTSTLEAMAAEGVHIMPAVKRPLDYGILVLDNMMAGGRVVADADRCSRLGAAFATHKWPVDDSGQRTGAKPVHDWTSHFCDAARYGATTFLSHYPRRTAGPERRTDPAPGTVGALLEQVFEPREEWLGQREKPRLTVESLGPIRSE